jgi:hypothetical protein
MSKIFVFNSGNSPSEPDRLHHHNQYDLNDIDLSNRPRGRHNSNNQQLKVNATGLHKNVNKDLKLQSLEGDDYYDEAARVESKFCQCLKIN